MREMADNLKLSKQQVYRFLKKENISEIRTKGNKKLYNAQTFQKISKYFENEPRRDKDKRNASSDSKENSNGHITIESLKLLQQTLQNAQKQLSIKDNQINDLHRLLDQQQQLNLSTNKQNEKLLGDRSQKNKNKSNSTKTYRNNAQEKNTKKPIREQKGFWYKLFH